MKRIAALSLVVVSALRADWAVYRAGPIEVYADGGQKEARQTLATFDQLRHTAAKLLGQQELVPLWPTRIVLVKNDRASARYKTAGLELRRDAYTGGLASGEPVPADWLREYAAQLIREAANPLPAAIQQGLVELLSTIEVNATRIRLGVAPAAPRRTRDWARMHLLCVNPEYFGRARVFFSNLQQGSSLDIAYRNAFERTGKEMEAEVDRHLQSGQFQPEEISGKPVDPERDYRARPLIDNRQEVFLADLLRGEEAKVAYLALINRGDKKPEAYEGAGMYAEATAAGSDSAPAWLAWAQMLESKKDLVKAREAIRRAVQLNPRWAEPHARLAAIEENQGLRIGMLKRATELEPRSVARWLALAEAQKEFKDYAAAGLSWRTAERVAPTEAERARIEKQRLDFEQQRIDLEAAERRRIEEEKAREIEKLKQDSLASIRAAEKRATAAANAGAAPVDPSKVMEWWDDKTPKKSLTGTLERVDCLGGATRAAVRDPAGKVNQLLLPQNIVVLGGEVSFACGPQKPPRKLKIEYAVKPDAKLATIGEVTLIEIVP